MRNFKFSKDIQNNNKSKFFNPITKKKKEIKNIF